jgi:hypothetical protein
MGADGASLAMLQKRLMNVKEKALSEAGLFL